MKYYEIYYTPKSHTDRPSQTYHSVFSAKDNDQYERELKIVTRGCEDWTVNEINREQFISLFITE